MENGILAPGAVAKKEGAEATPWAGQDLRPSVGTVTQDLGKKQRYPPGAHSQLAKEEEAVARAQILKFLCDHRPVNSILPQAGIHLSTAASLPAPPQPLCTRRGPGPPLNHGASLVCETGWRVFPSGCVTG